MKMNELLKELRPKHSFTQNKCLKNF